MNLPKLYANQSNKGKIDLTLSVNPLGCSPRVLKALRSITQTDISSYPDPASLENEICRRFDIDRSNLLLGVGSEQLIKLVAQTFLTKNSHVLVERGSFALFTIECQLTGATVKSMTIDNILSAPKPRMIFLANPKTPTGEVIDPEFITQIAEKLDPSILVVDEANGEFLEKSFITMSQKLSNVIVLRTFSKVLGLAGLRIGFAIGSKELIIKLRQSQQPFPVSQLSQKLAITAIKDQEFIDKTKRFIEKERKFVTSELRARNITVSNSVTNNLFISIPRASQIVKELANRGVSVIDGSFFPGKETPGFRISIKDRKTNIMFIKKLEECLACINKNKLIRSMEKI